MWYVVNNNNEKLKYFQKVNGSLSFANCHSGKQADRVNSVFQNLTQIYQKTPQVENEVDLIYFGK